MGAGGTSLLGAALLEAGDVPAASGRGGVAPLNWLGRGTSSWRPRTHGSSWDWASMCQCEESASNVDDLASSTGGWFRTTSVTRVELREPLDASTSLRLPDLEGAPSRNDCTASVRELDGETTPAVAEQPVERVRID